MKEEEIDFNKNGIEMHKKNPSSSYRPSTYTTREGRKTGIESYRVLQVNTERSTFTTGFQIGGRANNTQASEDSDVNRVL